MLGFRKLTDRPVAGHPEHVNARGGNEEILMHIVARAGPASILTLLLEHGADVDGRLAGQTPLHRASYHGKLEAGQCLVLSTRSWCS